ncbi:hypothetical protein AD15_5002 [Escherichia coli 3-105-05_S4_C2]|nr:hypothetical protein AD15_5002 [Escherichia coli 3-105-05_S4_C2]
MDSGIAGEPKLLAQAHLVTTPSQTYQPLRATRSTRHIALMLNSAR